MECRDVADECTSTCKQVSSDSNREREEITSAVDNSAKDVATEMKLLPWAGRFFSTVMSSIPSDAIKIDRFRCASVFLEKVDPADPVLERSALEKWLKSKSHPLSRGIGYRLML